MIQDPMHLQEPPDTISQEYIYKSRCHCYTNSRVLISPFIGPVQMSLMHALPYLFQRAQIALYSCYPIL
jgi:hypothetical protein